MTYEYIPKGVCSRRMVFTVKDGVVEDLAFEGGCNGNGKGIASLVKGLAVDEIITRLDGIPCGGRPTSCPAEFARALKAMKDKDAGVAPT